MVMALTGEEVGRAEGPPARVHPADPRSAALAIETTVRLAARDAGVSLPFRALWAGLAGAGRKGERAAVEIALRALGLARAVRVGMDVEGAHRDAFGTGPGVLLVVGTGSMAWGRDPEGREIRVGGWGETLGDEGSGYWLGLEGLRAVARAADGRSPSTSLSGTLLEALRLPGPSALIPWAASATKGEIAALAPHVLGAARAGDPTAEAVVEEGLEALRGHLEAVRARWPSGAGPIPMALVGGVVREGGPWGERLKTLVAAVGGDLSPGPVVPVRGAAWMARDLAEGS
jgi:glucosamine kinase